MSSNCGSSSYSIVDALDDDPSSSVGGSRIDVSVVSEKQAIIVYFATMVFPSA